MPTHPPPSLEDRILDLTGRPPLDETRARLAAFRLGLLVHVTAVAVNWWTRTSPFEPPLAVRCVLAGGLLACTLAALRPGWGRRATGAASALVAAEVVLRLPTTANHELLGLLALLALTVFGRDDADDPRLAMAGLRWLLVIVCTWAGLQKLLSGAWLHGEFLAFEIATSERFAVVFRYLMPAEEWMTLRGLAERLPGAGPYRLQAPLALAAAWAAWLGELGLPPLLLWERTRRFGVVALLGLFAAIEVGARELAFGGLFVQLTLLFWPGHPRRATLAFIVAAYVGGVAFTLGTR